MESEKNPRNVRLGEFILENMEAILVDWEDYARRFWVGPLPSSAVLRNHAQIMLGALVDDMSTRQTETERQSKSEGGNVELESAMNQAAMGHALARVNDGYDIGRMVAEFRALRASVSRIWWKSMPAPHAEQIEDMCRFNEALDELVAASLKGFSERIDRSRRLFLGILGHDLRQPLCSIKMFTEILTRPELPSSDSAMILSKMGGCCDSMAVMLSDLLDFTSTQLGATMPVQPIHCNFATICQEVVEELRAAAPDWCFRFGAAGDFEGEWDASRLRQLFSNLLSNAVQHGLKQHPVDVALWSSEDEVILAIHNIGQPIPAESIGVLFDPMVRIATSKDRPQGSIGLGLYVCREIAIAHQGGIAVESSAEKGTTFTVTLPKRSSVCREYPELD